MDGDDFICPGSIPNRDYRYHVSEFRNFGVSPKCLLAIMMSLFGLQGARVVSRAFSPRFLSSTSRVLSSDIPPKPPRPIDDSTSALDYKSSQRHPPPPLPVMDLPRSRTAEEAVTNILYNTPPPSLQPFKK